MGVVSVAKDLPWFRFYKEAVDDAKLRMLAFEDRWHYVAILCCKAQGLLDGEDDLARMRRKICVKLGVDGITFDEIERRLAAEGLIELNTLQPVAWDKRQFKGDGKDATNAIRQRDWRNRSRYGVAEMMKQQGGLCDCCGDQFETPYNKYVCLDHHHESGAVRALVCSSCNSVVGKIESGYNTSSPKKPMAEAYIRRHEDLRNASNVTGKSSLDSEADTDEEEGDKSPSSDYTQEFEDAWRLYPSRPGANKRAAFKAWNARIRQGHSAQAMFDGVARYAGYCIAMKTEPRFIKQPATFFGPDHHFTLDWLVPQASAGSRSHGRAEWMAQMTGQKGVVNGQQPGNFVDV